MPKNFADGFKKCELYSETAKMLFDELFKKDPFTELKEKSGIKPGSAIESMKELDSALKNAVNYSKKECSAEKKNNAGDCENRNPLLDCFASQVFEKPEKGLEQGVPANKSADEQKQTLDEVVIKQAPKQEEQLKKVSGRAPSLRDFDSLYFEKFFNIVGDRKAKYRAVLNLITSTSTIYIGPAGGGKSAIQDATKELLPKEMVISINNYGDVDENLKPETTNGKAWFARELQILLRGSKNQKDVLKLLSNNEDYKGMRIEFFVTSAAVENDYFQKFIVPNKELMRRLDIIEVKSDFNKIENIRNGISKNRMFGALEDKSEGLTKEHFSKWVSYWRSVKLDSIIDPFCAFHDQYFVKSFKSFDPIKRYHRLEDALLKMNLEENTYSVNGKEIQILSIRDKYRADIFRKEINKMLEMVDDAETIKKYYGWSDYDFAQYRNSIEKSKQEVDWQACWESGLESLKKAQQKGLIPASVISEYINRHVVNGKISVVDDYGEEEILLAEYPKPVEREKIIITEISYLPAKTRAGKQNLQAGNPLFPECQRHEVLPASRNQLALPAPKGD